MNAPARGYSWPAFSEGNAAAVKHGVWSELRLEPVVAKLAAGLVAEHPDLGRFPDAVLAWARAEARCLALAEWFSERGIFDDDGNERPGLRYVAQFERLAAELRARLGRDPRSEAELVSRRADATRSAFDLDALQATGRRALRERERSRVAVEVVGSETDP